MTSLRRSYLVRLYVEDRGFEVVRSRAGAGQAIAAAWHAKGECFEGPAKGTVSHQGQTCTFMFIPPTSAACSFNFKPHSRRPGYNTISRQSWERDASGGGVD